MNSEKIVIVGRSGFDRQHLSARLVREGHEVRVLTRQQEPAKIRSPLKDTEILTCDVHDSHALRRAFAGCTVAINLVGILNERGHNGRGFHRDHVELSQKVVESCRANGIARLLHMSALGADAVNGPSFYLRSKGEAENAVHASNLKVTSFRPSVIFGKGDSFFNRFAQLMTIPGPFPLACATARFAPIWVEDVVSCFICAIENESTTGRRYNLCGPKGYTLFELVQYTAHLTGKNKWIIPLGDRASFIQARLLELIPGKPFSRDNFNSMKSPSICSGMFPDVFKLAPQAIESVVPGYLGIGALA
jgi:NADH dehydrogenase